jgi:hypothetical protein
VAVGLGDVQGAEVADDARALGFLVVDRLLLQLRDLVEVPEVELIGGQHIIKGADRVTLRLAALVGLVPEGPGPLQRGAGQLGGPFKIAPGGLDVGLREFPVGFRIEPSDALRGLALEELLSILLCFLEGGLGRGHMPQL